jgi:hypothetical protein
MTSPYFAVTNFDENSSYQFPKMFEINSIYTNLSPYAKICWTILKGLQRHCMDIGWYEKKSGKIYFYHLDLIIEKYVTKDQIKASPHQLIEELMKYQLLETDELNQSKLKRYYLLKPKHHYTELISRQKEELDFLLNIQQMVKSDSRNKSFLLKEFVEEKGITNDVIINKLYEEVILVGKNESFDIEKLEILYLNIISKMKENIQSHNQQKTSNESLVEKAEKFMESHLSFGERAQLSAEHMVVLYQNFDKMDFLKKRGLFNISLLLSLKTKYKLNNVDFGSYLDSALNLYMYDENDDTNFAYFFEQLIQNKQIVEKEQILIDEITNKLYELPNHLKRFVYDQMLKMSEHFPDRYQLIIHNFRVINKIYQDKGGKETLPDEVFKHAFRNLGIENDIHNIVSYFKNGIDYALRDNTKEKDKAHKEIPTKQQTVVDEKTWLETIIDVKETKGAIENMSEEERENYFNKAEQLKKKLEMLKRDQ